RAPLLREERFRIGLRAQGAFLPILLLSDVEELGEYTQTLLFRVSTPLHDVPPFSSSSVQPHVRLLAFTHSQSRRYWMSPTAPLCSPLPTGDAIYGITPGQCCRVTRRREVGGPLWRHVEADPPTTSQPASPKYAPRQPKRPPRAPATFSGPTQPAPLRHPRR